MAEYSETVTDWPYGTQKTIKPSIIKTIENLPNIIQSLIIQSLKKLNPQGDNKLILRLCLYALIYSLIVHLQHI